MISYDASISACEKGRKWEHAFSLLRPMKRSRLEPNTISYNAVTSAGEKGKQ